MSRAEFMDRSKILDFTKAAIRSLPVQVKAKGTPGEVRAALAGYMAGQKRILELIEELQEYVKEVGHGNGY